MFRKLRSAYYAGWRAGMAGSHYKDSPYQATRHIFLNSMWLTGWETGIKKRLETWLSDNHQRRLAARRESRP